MDTLDQCDRAKDEDIFKWVDSLHEKQMHLSKGAFEQECKLSGFNLTPGSILTDDTARKLLGPIQCFLLRSDAPILHMWWFGLRRIHLKEQSCIWGCQSCHLGLRILGILSYLGWKKLGFEKVFSGYFHTFSEVF